MERVELRLNEVIFKDGDYQNWMYSVCEGSVDIYSGYGTADEKKLNTVTQGQAFGEIGMITMRCRILKDNILDIVIKDKGVGIADVDQAKKPAFTTGGTDRSGMGFTIMESFMTSLTITSEPGKGTAVHMRRRLHRRK